MFSCERFENIGKRPRLSRNFDRGGRAVVGSADTGSVRAGDGARGPSPTGSARVTVDRPVVQRAHPRGFVCERPESFRVIEGENLFFGTIVAQARAQTDLNGGMDVLDLLVSFLGGVDAQFAFGFTLLMNFFPKYMTMRFAERTLTPLALASASSASEAREIPSGSTAT